jgi:hypothetical protein
MCSELFNKKVDKVKGQNEAYSTTNIFVTNPAGHYYYRTGCFKSLQPLPLCSLLIFWIDHGTVLLKSRSSVLCSTHRFKDYWSVCHSIDVFASLSYFILTATLRGLCTITVQIVQMEAEVKRGQIIYLRPYR